MPYSRYKRSYSGYSRKRRSSYRPKVRVSPDWAEQRSAAKREAAVDAGYLRGLRMAAER